MMQSKEECKSKNSPFKILGVRESYRRAVNKTNTRRELIFDENKAKETKYHHYHPLKTNHQIASSTPIKDKTSNCVLNTADLNLSASFKLKWNLKSGSDLQQQEIDDKGIILPKLKLIELKGGTCGRKFAYYESPVLKLIRRNKSILKKLANENSIIENNNKGTIKTVKFIDYNQNNKEPRKQRTNKKYKKMNKNTKNKKKTSTTAIKDNSSMRNLDDSDASFEKKTPIKKSDITIHERVVQEAGNTIYIKRRTINKSFSPNNPCVLVQKSPNLMKNVKLNRNNLILNISNDDANTSSNDELSCLNTSNNSNSKKVDLDSSSNNLNENSLNISNNGNVSFDSDTKNKSKKPSSRKIISIVDRNTRQENNNGKDLVEKNINDQSIRKNDMKIHAIETPISPKEFNELLRNNEEFLINSNVNSRHKNHSKTHNNKKKSKIKFNNWINNSVDKHCDEIILENNSEVGEGCTTGQNLTKSKNHIAVDNELKIIENMKEKIETDHTKLEVNVVGVKITEICNTVVNENSNLSVSSITKNKKIQNTSNDLKSSIVILENKDKSIVPNEKLISPQEKIIDSFENKDTSKCSTDNLSAISTGIKNNETNDNSDILPKIVEEISKSSLEPSNVKDLLNFCNQNKPKYGENISSSEKKCLNALNILKSPITDNKCTSSHISFSKNITTNNVLQNNYLSDNNIDKSNCMEKASEILTIDLTPSVIEDEIHSSKMKPILKFIAKQVPEPVSKKNVQDPVNHTTDYDLVIPQHTCCERNVLVSEKTNLELKSNSNEDDDGSSKNTKYLDKSINSQQNATVNVNSLANNEKKQQQQQKHHNQSKSSLFHIQKSPSTNSTTDSAKGSSIDTEMDFSIVIGDIFWARFATYPFWPCIVYPDDEDRTVSVHGNNHQKQQIKIHVRFFADNGRRSWVPKSNLLPYKGRDDFERICKENLEKHSKKFCISKGFTMPRKKLLWEQAIIEADELILQPLENRCSEFEKILNENRLLLLRKRRRERRSSLFNETTFNFDEIWEQKEQQCQNKENSNNGDCDSVSSNTKELMKRTRSPTPESPAYESIDDLKSFVKRSRLEVISSSKSNINSTPISEDSTEIQKCDNNTKTKSTELQNNDKEADSNAALAIVDYSDSASQLQDNRKTPSLITKNDLNYGKEFKNFYDFLKSYILCGSEGNNNSLENDFRLHVEKLWSLRCQSKQSTTNFLNYNQSAMIMDWNIFTSNCRSARVQSNQMRKLEQLLGSNSNYNTPSSSPSSNLNTSINSSKNDLSNEKIKKKRVELKSRPIDKVVDDILELQKNYLFRGLNREPICKVCEKPSNLIKCAGNCQSWLHQLCLMVDQSDNSKSTSINVQSNLSEIKQKENVHVTDDSNVSNISPPLPKTNPQSVDLVSEAESKTTASVTTQSSIAIMNKEETIYCLQCKSGVEPLCFVCNKNDDERIRCHHSHCGKYFHINCLKYWPQTKLTKSSAKIESLLCPRHTCHTCVCDDPRGKFLQASKLSLSKCIKCPATYHLDSFCIPAGTYFLTATEIICPRHYGKSQKKIVNANWCFICAEGGSLICCETCPTAFHIECLKIPISSDEGYICEECETGRLPLYGELVWAKLSHFRWWPAIIIPPPEVPINITRKKHDANEFCVRFFGSNDHAWICRNKVFLYQEGDWGITSNKSGIDQAYQKGLEEARRIYSELKSKRLALHGNNKDREKRLTPPPYTKIKTNRPVPPVKLLELDINELTTCYCKKSDQNPCGPNSNCLNRILFTECNPKACPAGNKCQNQMFEKRLYPNLKISSTSCKGWGLVSTQFIKAGTFVIEYVGEIIDDAEFKRRIAQKQEERDEHYYFLTLEKDYMIDAGPKGNLARFMNHSCEPNCETQKWNVNGVTRIGLFAIKDIPPNTELTFNYNLQCIGNDKKVCHCGAEKCTGYIGAKYKEPISVNESEGLGKRKKIIKNKDVEKVPAKKLRKSKKLELKSSTVEKSDNSAELEQSSKKH